MSEYLDSRVPADMVGCDEPSEFVDVIIEASDPLGPHLQVFLDGSKTAEQMIFQINLSQGHCYKYDKSEVPLTPIAIDKNGKVHPVFNKNSVPIGHARLDDNGAARIVKKDFREVRLVIASVIPTQQIPKPWMRWVSGREERKLPSCERFQVIGTSDPSMSEEPPVREGPPGLRGPIGPAGPPGEAGPPGLGSIDLQRLMEQLDAQRRQQEQEGISNQRNFTEYMDELIRNRRQGGPEITYGISSGDSGSPVPPSSSGSSMSSSSSSESSTPSRAFSSGQRLRNLLLAGRAEELPEQDEPDQEDRDINSQMRQVEHMEEYLRNRTAEHNDEEPFNYQRFQEATDIVSALRRPWNQGVSSFGAAQMEVDAPPAVQFGGIELEPIGNSGHLGVNISLSPIFTDGPNRNGDMIAPDLQDRFIREFEERASQTMESFIGQPIDERTRIEMEHQMEQMVRGMSANSFMGVATTATEPRGPNRGGDAFPPHPLRHHYTTPFGPNDEAINLALFDMLSQLWIGLDTWAHSLTPINSIRRIGILGRRMNAHSSSPMSARENGASAWTARTADLVNLLRGFSDQVHSILMDLSNAESMGLTWTEESQAISRELIEAIVSHDRPDMESCADHLHTLLFSAYELGLETVATPPESPGVSRDSLERLLADLQ